MKNYYSVEIDNNPTALMHTLKKMEEGIPDFDWDWRLIVNSGGIDYGVYLNVDIDRREIEICNQPRHGDGEDTLDDILENFEDEWEDDEEV